MTISNAKVKEIFDMLKIKINSITKIDTLSNFLLKVETNKINYFLKVYDNKREDKTGHKLAKLYPFLLKNNVPVPKVLKFDDSLKIIKHPYLIITEIEGKMLCDSINKKEMNSFYYDLGKIIAKIHSITFDKFGETFDGEKVIGYSEIDHKGPFNSWKEMHKEIINYRLSYFKGTYFEDLIQPIKAWFKKNSNLIDYEIIPRLLHIDLNQKNIFLKNDKISGIIDFDGAFVGHNEEELMRTESANFSNDEELKKSFFKGYTQLIKLDDNYEQRRTFYYLSRLLVHIDCIIQYGNNYVNVEKEQIIVRTEINKILSGKHTDFDKNKPNT
jgi:fructosamine-3-kinase